MSSESKTQEITEQPDGWNTNKPNTLYIGFAVIMTVTLIVLSILHWVRNTNKNKATFMEGFRIVIILMLLVTLFQPEFKTTTELSHKPELVILVDDSKSMETKDIVNESGNIISRKEWLDNYKKDEPWKKQLSGDYSYSIRYLSEFEDKDAEIKGTNLNDAMVNISKQYKNLKAIILMTDGDWNQGGAPTDATGKLRNKKISVFPVAIGKDQYLPDIILESVKAEPFCLKNERVTIPFEVSSYLGEDTSVSAELQMMTYPNQWETIKTKSIFLKSGQTISENILWQAKFNEDLTQKAKDVKLRINIPVRSEEIVQENNLKDFTISVREEKLKVLVIDSLPRWEYRFIRNALSRDPGVDVDCLLLHPNQKPGGGVDYIKKMPSEKNEISKYDVIFLGDVGLGGNELEKKHLELIKGVVEQQASGLLFLPGKRGRIYSLLKSPIANMLPVLLDESKPKGQSFSRESKLKLSRLGRDHRLTMLTYSGLSNGNLWKNLPGFYWHAAVKKALPGTEVLATHDTTRNDFGSIPLLVTKKYGNGNVLFMGTESAWKWRKGVEDLYHYRFWAQIVRWMAHPRHKSYKKGIRLIYTPENPQQEKEIKIQATIFDKNGYPTNEHEVITEIKSPDGSIETVKMTPVEGGWGLFKGTFTPLQNGKYIVKTECKKLRHKLITEINVQEITVEKVGFPTNYESLSAVAQISSVPGNKVELTLHTNINDVYGFANKLVEEKETIRSIFSLWAQWWWGAIIVLFFTLYWAFRKIWGFV